MQPVYGGRLEPKLVARFGAFLATWHLPPDARERVARYIAETTERDESATRERDAIQAELERLRNLHRWGDLPDDEYLSERRHLDARLKVLPASTEDAPSDEASALLGRVGELWAQMTDGERRAFVEEVFEEVRLGRDQTIPVRVRPAYRELVYSSLDEWWSSDPSRHGAATPYAKAFVGAVRPEVALISAGLDNRYGHPTPETPAALAGVPTYRTDRDGTVALEADGSRITVQAHANGLAPPRAQGIPRLGR